MKLIERLRNKPKEIRVQVSFLAALCVTGVVGLFWGVTLPMRLDGFPDGVTGTEGQASEETLDSFFARAQDNLGQLIGGAGEEAVPQDAGGEANNAFPKSDAYRAGPPSTSDDYNGYPPEDEREPVVAPVNRPEVRIGTTTSSTRDE